MVPRPTTRYHLYTISETLRDKHIDMNLIKLTGHAANHTSNVHGPVRTRLTRHSIDDGQRPDKLSSEDGYSCSLALEHQSQQQQQQQLIGLAGPSARNKMAGCLCYPFLLFSFIPCRRPLLLVLLLRKSSSLFA